MISYERVRQKLVFVPLAVYSYGNGKRLARRLVPTAVQFIGHTLLPSARDAVICLRERVRLIDLTHGPVLAMFGAGGGAVRLEGHLI
jgi:hypothetical protein